MRAKQNVDLTVAENLLKMRKELGLSQDRISKDIGVCSGTVSLMERGKVQVSEVTQNLICKTYGVRKEWLKTGKGEMFQEADDESIDIVTRAMQGESETKKQLMRMIASMPDDLIECVINYWQETKKKTDNNVSQ